MLQNLWELILIKPCDHEPAITIPLMKLRTIVTWGIILLIWEITYWSLTGISHVGKGTYTRTSHFFTKSVLSSPEWTK